MSPESTGAELLAVALAVGCAVGLGLVWGRARRFRLLIRPVAVLACLATAAAAGLLWVNAQVDTYPTWASLFSSTGTAAAPAAVAVPASRGGAGRVLTLSVAGRASHLTMPMYAYLPAAAATEPTTRFPVIEALHGYPGSPLTWLRKLRVAQVLDAEIGSGRMAPTVVLFPFQTPNPMLDTECADLVGGPQTETFLTVDVPQFAAARLPVRTDRDAWGLIGYSAGGYCASNLLLRHPDRYVAGASLSGYVNPGIAIGNGTERTTYDDGWRLTHLPIPAVALYLAAARADAGAVRHVARFVSLGHPPMTVSTAFVDGGGHNAPSWQAMEAQAFDWLSTWLARPVPGSAPTRPA